MTIVILLLVLIIVLICTKPENRVHVLGWIIVGVLAVLFLNYVFPLVVGLVWESGIVQGTWKLVKYILAFILGTVVVIGVLVVILDWVGLWNPFCRWLNKRQFIPKHR